MSRPVSQRPTPERPGAARQQLGHLEGLGHVVVGAHPEAGHLVGDLAPRGEHQHGRVDAALAHRLEHLEAVQPRQADVEDHEVEGLGGRAGQPRLAVAGVLHRVALAAQAVVQREHEPRFVFHEQHPLGHAWGSYPCSQWVLGAGRGPGQAFGRAQAAQPCRARPATAMSPAATSGLDAAAPAAPRATGTTRVKVLP